MKEFQVLGKLTYFTAFTATAVLLLYTCYAGQQQPNEECIGDIEAFAYEFPQDSSGTQRTILPSPPWIEVGQLSNYDTADLLLARTIDSEIELWAKWYQSALGPNDFVLFYPESNRVQVVSSKIEGTDVWVDTIYLDSNGGVWGKNVWTRFSNNSMNVVPALSKYSEIAGRFEFEDSAPTINIDGTDPVFDLPTILLDQHGEQFWLFADDDGIYTYEISGKLVEKIVDLKGIEVRSASLGYQGEVYLQRSVWASGLAEGEIYVLAPDSSTLRALEIPLEPWPDPGKLFVDQLGRLWLGVVGRREVDGKWALLHQNTEGYFAMEFSGQGFLLASPEIILESIDGRLWLSKYRESDNGLAWYNPNTGEGCWFTNSINRIVEDSSGNLWILVEGTLYKLVLADN